MITGYRLGLAADLHAGSRYALVPPKWWNQSDSIAPARPWMEAQWHKWEHFCLNCPKLDVLIIDGDIMEGSGTQRDAMDAITDSFVTQGHMAETALGMLLDHAKPKEWWLLRGTSFHDGKYYETVESVARNLKAQQWADHRWSGEVLEGNWRGLNLNVTHHQTMGTIYAGTAASRDTRFASAAIAQGKANPVDIIVRAHLHQKGIGCYDGIWFISLPAWKIVYPYPIKKMGFHKAMVANDTGAVIVETDGNRRIYIDDKTFRYQNYLQPVRDLTPRGRYVGDGKIVIDETSAPRRPGRSDRSSAGGATRRQR